MATWHQLNVRTVLYHQTEWTVVEDPHNGLRTLSTFGTKTAAQVYLARVHELRPYVPAYILPPAKEGK